MAWWTGFWSPADKRERIPHDDNVTFVDEHVLLIRRPLPPNPPELLARPF